MFNPKTERLVKLAVYYKKVIEQLKRLLAGTTNMYIDYANVRPWATKLKWNVDLKRLKQFLNSFDNITAIRFYDGTLIGDEKSERKIASLQKLGFNLKTKPVKIMRQSIDFSSIKADSPDLLVQFIRKCLLRKYDLETIEYLNRKFKELNDKGEYFLEDLKCNFDVEIGRDMLLDYERDHAGTFVLWSGDSDFADPIEQLLDDGKNVILFATVGRVAKELNALRSKGLFIFDIQKIRNFICWHREIDEEGKLALNAKEIPSVGPLSSRVIDHF